MSDTVLMWGIAVLLPVTAWMRIDLAKRKKQPMSGAGVVQALLFPVAFLIAAILFQTGAADILIPVLLLGVLEELLCWMARKRMDPAQTGGNAGNAGNIGKPGNTGNTGKTGKPQDRKK